MVEAGLLTNVRERNRSHVVRQTVEQHLSRREAAEKLDELEGIAASRETIPSRRLQR